MISDSLRKGTCFGLVLAALVMWSAVAPLSDAQPMRRPLELEIQDILDRNTGASAWWGVYVADVRTGEVFYGENASRSFIPASVTKLFTTAAALELLGPDFRYDTRLLADGVLENGVLEGNLVVRGSGDPTIGSQEYATPPMTVFKAWADSLKARGITRISGDIIGDNDLFADTPLGSNWAWDDEVYGYSAQISALSFHDNVVEVVIRGGAEGSAGIVSWEPGGTGYVQVQNATVSVAQGQRLQEGYDRARGTNRIRLRSQVPAGSTDRESIAIHNPTLFFVHVLREVLLQEGISIGGNAIDTDELSIKPSYASLMRVASHRSPPLSDIVRVINKESQNLYAELLLRTVAATYPLLKRTLEHGSANMGVAVAKQIFARAEIDTSRLQLVDGSGLSRKNLVTPFMAVRLLRYMSQHPDMAVRTAFTASLAVGGKDGTLDYRFRAGRTTVLAKTGSMGNVSTLSGYVDTAGGRRLAFALFCNHFTGSVRPVRQTQDQLVTLLASRL